MQLFVPKCIFVQSMTIVATHWSQLHQMFSCHFYDVYCTRFGRERVNMKIFRMNKRYHVARFHIVAVHHYVESHQKHLEY